MDALPLWRPLLLFCCLVLSGCSDARTTDDAPRDVSPPPIDGKLFTRLPSTYTGVAFENRLTETRERNVFTYRNAYNGGGVALGDLAGDSLPDIVLTANDSGPRLFLNLGEFRFRDVTKAAGLETGGDSWTTGVTLADVNGDGRLDIYLSRAGSVEPRRRANQLWISQGLQEDGVPRFKEMAARYGVADEGYATHAAFVDYDRDGDLDLFLINNSPRPVSSFGSRNVRNVRHPYGGHKLYRNDPSPNGSGQAGRFVDVSARAGIYGSEVGFGLGIAVGDVNRDGWPDIYIANDFFERDYLYVNKGDGTFAESLEKQMPYGSYFSMGLDIADVDNDGWPDVYTTDMLPDDEARLKTTSSFDSWDVYQAKVRTGYGRQFMRNMLQRNNGDGTFSDIGQLAGVSRTDWSWSALITDLDLDGYKDIYVTNGLLRDVTSQDYIAFLANQKTMEDARKAGRGKVDFMKLVNAMTSTRLANFAFRNHGDWTFSNEAATWGLDTPSFSSGAAYGDLDGDGALDLVVNNVNAEAFIYRNNARTLRKDNHYLQVRLEGEGKNRFAIGARVTLRAAGEQFVQELAPARGFQSSVDYVLTFGVGPCLTIDTLTVEWPDGRESVLRHVATNERLTVRQADATGNGEQGTGDRGLPAERETLLADVTAELGLTWTHRENAFADFDRERLMPRMVSTEGPLVAVADVNGDGLDDMYLGGAKDQPGALLIQQGNGRFSPSNPGVFEPDSTSEDVGAVFFDANGDRHPDLYVVSGGNEFSEMASALQDRLYLNDGRGQFRKADGNLPVEGTSGSRAVVADYDGDGDIDVYVGGRVVPWRYGADPQGMLLQNDGRGRFTDVTPQLAPDLARAGMVTDAAWRDVDGDGRPDLVVVGEWMPITIFRNVGGGRLARLAVPGLEHSAGWWNRIVAGDFTGDGRVDFIVGNAGLNSRCHATASEPVTMYVKDFDRNGFAEQVVSCYNHGVSYPLVMRDDLIRTLPFLKARYLNYTNYARQTVTDMFSKADLADAMFKSAQTFATTLVRDDGRGKFTLVPLPREAQLAPVFGILAQDVDDDGKTDLLIAGNLDEVKLDIGAMHASYGLVLRGDGRGTFTPVPTTESGFFVPGQTRDIQRIRTRDGALYVVARNNDRPLLFRAARRGAEVARR